MFRWIDPDQITCLRDAGQLEETLTPNARAGGKKMVVVPSGASTAYVLEMRRRLGYDRTHLPRRRRLPSARAVYLV